MSLLTARVSRCCLALPSLAAPGHAGPRQATPRREKLVPLFPPVALVGALPCLAEPGLAAPGRALPGQAAPWKIVSIPVMHWVRVGFISVSTGRIDPFSCMIPYA